MNKHRAKKLNLTLLLFLICYQKLINCTIDPQNINNESNKSESRINPKKCFKAIGAGALTIGSSYIVYYLVHRYLRPYYYYYMSNKILIDKPLG